MKPLLFLATATLLVLSGCASIDDAIHPGVKANESLPTATVAAAIKEGHGRIGLYRTVPQGPGVPPVASIDGGFNYYIRPQPSRYVDLPPGRHIVSTDRGNRLELDLSEGEEVFVRFDLDPPLFGKGFFPVRVDVATGRREYKAHSGIDTEKLGSPK